MSCMGGCSTALALSYQSSSSGCASWPLIYPTSHSWGQYQFITPHTCVQKIKANRVQFSRKTPPIGNNRMHLRNFAPFYHCLLHLKFKLRLWISYRKKQDSGYRESFVNIYDKNYHALSIISHY